MRASRSARVAGLRDPEPLALLRALDVAAQRADLALELAADAGFGLEPLVLGLQGPAGLLGGPQVAADGLLDVLDAALTTVRRDGIEADGVDVEHGLRQHLRTRHQVVEQELAPRVLDTGPPGGRRRRSRGHQRLLSARRPAFLNATFGKSA